MRLSLTLQTQNDRERGEMLQQHYAVIHALKKLEHS